MRWFIYPFKCLLFGFLAMQAYFAIQIGLWTTINPDSTAFQRAERWRLCTWHWTCPIQSKWTPYDKISGNLKRAVLVSEDDIFFQHKGVRVEDMQKAWEKIDQANKRKPHYGVAQQLPSNWQKIYFYPLSKTIFVRAKN